MALDPSQHRPQSPQTPNAAPAVGNEALKSPLLEATLPPSPVGQKQWNTIFDKASDLLWPGELRTTMLERVDKVARELNTDTPGQIQAAIEKLPLLDRHAVAATMREAFRNLGDFSIYVSPHPDDIPGREGLPIEHLNKGELLRIARACLETSDISQLNAQHVMLQRAKLVPDISPPLRLVVAASIGGALALGGISIVPTPLALLAGGAAFFAIRGHMMFKATREYFGTGYNVENFDAQRTLVAKQVSSINETINELFIDPNRPYHEANSCRADIFLIFRTLRIFDVAPEAIYKAFVDTFPIGLDQSALNDLLAHTLKKHGLQCPAWRLLDLYVDEPTGSDKDLRELIETLHEAHFTLQFLENKAAQRDFASRILAMPQSEK